MKNLSVGVRLSWPSSNRRDDKYAVLKLRDITSGSHIIDVELTADQVAAILSSGEGVGPAEFTATPERLGRTYVHEAVEIPETLKRHLGKTPSIEMENFGNDAASGWENYTWTRHNFGWALTVWRYDESRLDAQP